MREEKVKGLLFLGEKAVFAHGGPFIVRPGNKRRSSGEPAKTGFSTRLGPPWAHLSLLKQQASCQKRLGYGFVSPLVSPARKLAPHPPSLFSPFSRETVPAQSSTDFLTHTLRLWQKKGAVPAALRRAFGRTPPRLGVT